MHGHRFLRQRRTGAAGILDVFGRSVLKSIAAEGAPGLRGEQRGSGLTGALGKPDAQMGDGARGQRRDSLLSPLAVAADMRARAEVDIKTAQADQFGGAKPRLYREGE